MRTRDHVSKISAACSLGACKMIMICRMLLDEAIEIHLHVCNMTSVS